MFRVPLSPIGRQETPLDNDCTSTIDHHLRKLHAYDGLASRWRPGTH